MSDQVTTCRRFGREDLKVPEVGLVPAPGLGLFAWMEPERPY